jgi:tetraacyldisaccharide 4'-kinase
MSFLLIPLSYIYGAITGLRNMLYDKRWLKSVKFNIPVIGIGNLNMGGTGKSPLIEFLLLKLRQEFALATMSRGYGRKTHGFRMVEVNSTALESGDEPLLFKLKFPEVAVSVSEDRVLGIPRLLQIDQPIDAVLLDDVFQHRAIKPGLQVLVTDYSKLFTRDHVFPRGWLREARENYHRADIIVVSKCPEDMSPEQRDALLKEIQPKSYQHVYFASLKYGNVYTFSDNAVLKADSSILLLCGIANPAPLQDYLKQRFAKMVLKEYKDHHIFDQYDLENIRDTIKNMGGEVAVMTTEKDAMRLLPYKEWFAVNNIPVFVQAVHYAFLFGGEELLLNDLRSFIHAAK